MLRESIQFLKTHILQARREKVCSSEEAKIAWENVSLIKENGEVGESLICILAKRALYGQALPFDIILEGFIERRGEGAL
ncbi:hypothetical protein [Metabacillus fastidiosus]|uniref:hypothetical protein n=1 Tax=Metabacillus fastidiosus TaxID=1458 RepID=UPI003D276F98